MVLHLHEEVHSFGSKKLHERHEIVPSSLIGNNTQIISVTISIRSNDSAKRIILSTV
jgi:hypothetical protein